MWRFARLLEEDAACRDAVVQECLQEWKTLCVAELRAQTSAVWHDFLETMSFTRWPAVRATYTVLERMGFAEIAPHGSRFVPSKGRQQVG